MFVFANNAVMRQSLIVPIVLVAGVNVNVFVFIVHHIDYVNLHRFYNCILGKSLESCFTPQGVFCLEHKVNYMLRTHTSTITEVA